MNNDYFWFRFFKTRGIGTKRLISIAEILKAKGVEPKMLPTSESALSADFPELAKILNGRVQKEDTETIRAEYEALKRDKIGIIHPWHPDYAAHLLEIAPILFVKGRQELLSSESVSIVGARKVSDKGARVARDLAGGLAKEGVNIVSGYARGVDSEAHLGALAAEGTTTVVLPHGIKQLREKSAFREYNWDQDILAVSQFAPDVRWWSPNAMERNKLVCALAKAVVVIESGPERDEQGKMSGTFAVAQTALGMGLAVFVLDPDFLDNPPAGNAALIALGAHRLDPEKGSSKLPNTSLAENRMSVRIKTNNCAF